MTFGSRYREVRKNECSRKRDFLGTMVRFNISLSQCRFFIGGPMVFFCGKWQPWVG